MFGLFASNPFIDPQLGVLVRRRGLWRGTIELAPGVNALLALSGSRAAPAADALHIAVRLPQSFAGWRPAIEGALYEHYSPYAESVAAGEDDPPPGGLPRIDTPADS
ncbi:MAG: hypothetical protein ACREUX_15430 [Burkholderiales bacterium]